MKFSSIKNIFFKICDFDNELLKNTNRRPYLLILKLIYNGKRQDFAIPFRSNISNRTPKELYYPLPPRPSTKSGNVHGLHYIKMFPIKKVFLEKFNIDNDEYYQKILSIINKNKNIIIEQAQSYIKNYENGERVDFCTNIDEIFLTINEFELAKQNIETSNKEVAVSQEKIT